MSIYVQGTTLEARIKIAEKEKKKEKQDKVLFFAWHYNYPLHSFTYSLKHQAPFMCDALYHTMEDYLYWTH